MMASANKEMMDVETSESDDDILDRSQLRLRNIEDNRRYLSELGFPLKSPEDNSTTLAEGQSKETKDKKRKKGSRTYEGPPRPCHSRTCKEIGQKRQKMKNDKHSKQTDNSEMNSPLFKIPVVESRRKIHVLSLFDGIGSGLVSLKSLGIKVEVYFTSEINGKADLVTRLNHNVIPLGNVLHISRELLEQISPIDLIIAGPPCNDLSVVNPRRQGFKGSGRYIFKFLSILQDIESINGDSRPTFWLLENTAHMLLRYKAIINDLLKREPVRCDAKHFTGMRRARSFWGNIPRMCSSTFDTCENPETLDDVLSYNKKRKAMVPYARTITTSSNSLSIKNGVKGGLVIDNGKQCNLTVGEIERLFGLPLNYTGVQNMNPECRRTLLGRAWCIPVIKHLLSPLKHYFRTRNSQ
ncbi:DNA (cytosine-5)-methyltransferase 3A [Mactra antiquata]